MDARDLPTHVDCVEQPGNIGLPKPPVLAAVFSPDLWRFTRRRRRVVLLGRAHSERFSTRGAAGARRVKASGIVARGETAAIANAARRMLEVVYYVLRDAPLTAAA